MIGRTRAQIQTLIGFLLAHNEQTILLVSTQVTEDQVCQVLRDLRVGHTHNLTEHRISLRNDSYIQFQTKEGIQGKEYNSIILEELK